MEYNEERQGRKGRGFVYWSVILKNYSYTLREMILHGLVITAPTSFKQGLEWDGLLSLS